MVGKGMKLVRSYGQQPMSIGIRSFVPIEREVNFFRYNWSADVLQLKGFQS